MVNFAGKYELVKNENFVEYLLSLGPEVTGAIAAGIDQLKTVLTVTIDGQNYTLHSDNGSAVKSSTLNFKSNQSFEEQLITGMKTTTSPVVDDKSIVLKSVDAEGRSGERLYEFNDSGLTITYKSGSNSIVAKRIFKRI